MNVNPYTIACSGGSDDNYSFSYVNGTLTVSKRPVTVTADAQTKVYGQTDPTFTYQITSGNLVNGDTFSGALTRAAGQDVGSYAILQDTLTLGGNYNLSFVSHDLTITPATLSVVANSQTKVYGSADPALTYAASGFQYADTVATVLTGGLARVSGENVGSYAINQGALTANDNYTINFTGSSLAITPTTLSVVANPQTKVYGSADPALTYQATGFKFTDTVASVLSGALTRAAGETVVGGPYAISQGTLVANPNYTIAFTGNLIDITTATLTVSAHHQTKVYGDSDPDLTYSATGFQFSDTNGSVLSGSLTRAAGENVGSYAITQGTLAVNPNYTISFTANTLSITPATLTVKADPKTKVYGNPDPALTFVANGFLFSDMAATVLTGSLARVSGENVGSYAINQGTLAANGNYIINFAGDTLEITQRPVTVTADAQTKVYGNADPALTYQVTSGSVVSGDTFSGGA